MRCFSLAQVTFLGIASLSALALAGCGIGGSSGTQAGPTQPTVAETVIAIRPVVPPVREAIDEPDSPGQLPLPYEASATPTPALTQEPPPPELPKPVPESKPQLPTVLPPTKPDVSLQSSEVRPQVEPKTQTPPIAATPAPWGSSAAVSSQVVIKGRPLKITASVVNLKQTAALIDIEIRSPDGTKVYQQTYPNVFIAAGVHQFTASWNVPRTVPTGKYKVSLGVFAPQFGQLYHWNDEITTFMVTDG